MHPGTQGAVVVNRCRCIDNDALANLAIKINDSASQHHGAKAQSAVPAHRGTWMDESRHSCTCIDQELQLGKANIIIANGNKHTAKITTTTKKLMGIADYRPMPV